MAPLKLNMTFGQTITSKCLPVTSVTNISIVGELSFLVLLFILHPPLISLRKQVVSVIVESSCLLMSLAGEVWKKGLGNIDRMDGVVASCMVNDHSYLNFSFGYYL